MKRNLILLQSPGSSNPILGFLPILFICHLLFPALHADAAAEKAAEEDAERTKSGDTVVTNGGIIGTIVKLDDDTMVLRVKPDNIKRKGRRSLRIDSRRGRAQKT